MTSDSYWLKPFSWEFVVAQNEVLCRQKSAHHGPTSDGHAVARSFWEDARDAEMNLY